MTETTVTRPAPLTAVTNVTQERKIGVRRLDPPPGRAGRFVRFSRLPLAALTWVVLGLSVLISVLLWLVVVPVVDLAVASYGRARQLAAGWARR